MNKIKNSKKGMLILSLLLLFLIIGAASAADDKISNETISTTTDVVSVDSDEQASTAEPTLGSVDADSILKASNNEDNLKADNSSSFSDLEYLIKITDGEVKLSTDYSYAGSSDSNGITISKNNLIIDGDGHTIDGMNTVRAFYITGNNITLKNLHIKNTLSNSLWTGNDANLINISYTDAISPSNKDYLPGINFQGDNVNIDGCTFKNIQRLKSNGGADVSTILTFSGVNVNVQNSLFTDCITSGRSMIVVLGSCGGNNIFKNCTFNNLRGNQEFNIFIRGVSVSFTDCKFLNCSARSAQTIYCTGTLRVSNTLFEDINPVHFSYGGCVLGDNAILTNCTFKNLLFGNYFIRAQQATNCTFINVLGFASNTGVFLPALIIKNSTFTNLQGVFNTAPVRSPIRISDSIFINNTINDDYLINLYQSSSHIFNNITFIANNAKTALINVDNGISVDLQDLHFIDTYAPENITNNGVSFTPRTIVYVSDNPTGDGSSRTSTTTLSNALSIIDTGGTIIIINGTHTVNEIASDCDITGEDNVLINVNTVTISKFRNFKNIDFNNTKRFNIGSYTTLTNATFTNIYNPSLTGFYYMYGVDYYTFNNVTIKDSDFNNKRLFYFLNSNNQVPVLSFNCNNLTVDNVKRLSYIVYEQCLANSHFNDITITNTTFAGLLYATTGLSNTMSSFNRVTVRDSNVTGYFIVSQNNAKSGVITYNDFVLDNIITTAAGQSFIVLRYNQVMNGFTISNLKRNDPRGAIFQLNGYNSFNTLNNVELYNIYDTTYLIHEINDDTLNNIYIHDINSMYGVSVESANNQNAKINNLTIRDCNFTHSAVCLGESSVMSNSMFDNINASINVYQNNVKIDNCTFKGMSPVNGSVYITGEYAFILNSNFIDNIARDCAGAIFVKANGSQILNTKFQNNNATNYGGAVFISPNVYYYKDKLSTVLDEENEVIHPLLDGIYRIGYIPTYDLIYIDPSISDYALDDVAYMHEFKQALTLINPNGKIISLYGNDSYTYDLSNYVFAKMNVSITGHNTTVKMNQMLSISEYASDFSISNYKFIDASERVFLWEGEYGRIINCTFKDNVNSHEDAYGSVIDVEASHLSIINSSFIGNHMEQGVVVGGLVYFNSTDLLIDNCTFFDNRATTANCIYLTSDSRDILINQSIFKENKPFTTTAVSGCVLVEAYNVTFNNCDFIANTIGVGDGSSIVLNSVGGLVNIDDCTFVNNSATNGGAVKVNRCPSLTFNNDEFLNNTATNGGAIYTLNKFEFSNDNKFLNNSATNGGALYLNNANDYNFGAIFIGNNASGNGGAIYVPNGVSLTLTDASFDKNDATKGSAIYNDGTVTISGTNEFKNHQKNSAIYNNGILTITPDRLKHTSFSNNNATNGGAIYNIGNATLTLVEFNDNTATGKGGAIYNTGALTINQGEFNRNKATGDSSILGSGGAIYTEPTISVNEVLFNQNAAGYAGGAIYTKSPLTLNSPNDVFEDNSARNGGAIYAEDTLNINHTVFNKNTVEGKGGAVYGEKSIMINDATFGESSTEGNTATLDGGAVYGEGSISVTGSTLSYNTGQWGGAIYADDTLTVTDSTLESNAATVSAGAVYAYKDLIITDSSFKSNTAVNNGGAVVVSGALTVKGSLFDANTALTGDGGAIYAGDNVDIQKSVFTRNKVGPTGKGGAIYLNGNGNINIKGVEFSENEAMGNHSASCIYLEEGAGITLTDVSVHDNKHMDPTAPTPEHDGGCEIHLPDLNSVSILLDSLDMDPDAQKLCIDGTWYSKCLYVNTTGGGKGVLGFSDATTLSEALQHILPGGIIMMNGEVFRYDENAFSNLNNITFVGNVGTGNITTVFSRTSGYKILNSTVAFENIVLQSPIDIGADSNVSIEGGLIDTVITNFGGLNIEHLNVTDDAVINYALHSHGNVSDSIVSDLNITKALFNVAGDVKFSNITFSHNTVDTPHGLIVFSAGESSIVDAVFFDNVVNGDALIRFDGGNNVIMGSSFSSNSGEGIHVITVNNGNVLINGSDFVDNHLNGSAVYYGQYAGGIIFNSTFTDNTARHDVRNINITVFDNVQVLGNTLDAFITLSNKSTTYGLDYLLTGVFDAGVNYPISGYANITGRGFVPMTVDTNNVYHYALNGGVVPGGLLDAGEYTIINTIDNIDSTHKGNIYLLNDTLILTVKQAVMDLNVTHDGFDTIINLTHKPDVNLSAVSVTVYIVNGDGEFSEVSCTGNLTDGAIVLPDTLMYGTNNVIVIYSDANNNYIGGNLRVPIVIDRQNSTINITSPVMNQEILVGESYTIIISNNTAIVVSVDGIRVSGMIWNGTHTLIKDVPTTLGNHTVVVEVANTHDWKPNSQNVTYSIVLRQSDISINSPGNASYIAAEAPDIIIENNGIGVDVFINNMKVATEIINSTHIKVSAPPRDVGVYNITVSVNNLTHYQPKTVNLTYTIYKKYSEINITINPQLEVIPMGTAYTIRVGNSTGVNVTINGKKYNLDNNGYILDLPSAEDGYTVVVSVLDTSRFFENTTSLTYGIGRRVANITITGPENVTFGDSYNITVSNNTAVKVVIKKGSEETETTLDDEGHIVSLPVDVGTYKVLVSVVDNLTFFDKTVEFEYKILSAAGAIGEIIYEPDYINRTFNAGEDYRIKLTNSTPVSVIINGKPVSVDENGYINNLSRKEGEYIITVSVIDDVTYKDKPINSTYYIVKKAVDVDSITVTINPVDNVTVGQAVNVTVSVPYATAGDKVTIKVGTTEYLATVDSNGVANLTVKPETTGTLNISVQYNGNENISSSDVINRSINVIGKSNSVSLVVSADNVTVGSPVVVKVKTNNTDVIDTGVPVVVNGETYTATYNATEDAFVVSIPANVLAAGEYTAVVNLAETAKFVNASNKTVFSVSKKDVVLSEDAVVVTPESVTVGQMVNITVTAPEGAKQGDKVTIKVGDNQYTATVGADGKANLTVAPTKTGDLPVSVQYAGNDELNASNVVVKSVKVGPKLNATVIIDAVSVVEIDDAIQFIVSTNSDSALVVKVNNVTISPVDGYYIYTPSVAGSYSISAYVAESDKYYNAYNSTSFDAVKHNSTISIESEKEYTIGEAFTIPVSSNNIESAINVTINGKNYTVSDGKVLVDGLGLGEYTIVASVGETGKFLGSTASKVFSVVKKELPSNVTISISAPVYAGENVTVKLENLPEDATGPVVININNNSYAIDDVKNTKEISIPVQSSGDYNITVNYLGDDRYDGISNKSSFSVSKVPVNVSDANVSVSGASAGKDIHVSADLPGDAGGNITVLVDGKAVTTVPAKGGSNIISVPGVGEGNHNVTVVYSGDGKYTGFSTTSSVRVSPGLVETDRAAGKAKLVMDFYDGTYYVVRAYGDDGLPVPAGEVVGFHVHNRDYNGITDKNGYARLIIRLNPGTYVITAQYHNYKISQKIQVKQTLKLVKKTVSVKKGKKITLKVKLSWTLKQNKGKSLKGKKIVFKFKGKKYSAKTNSKGIAKVVIKNKKVLKKLKKGKKYRFTATYVTNIVKGIVKIKK